MFKSINTISILYADKQFFVREGVVSLLKKEGNYRIKTVDTEIEFMSAVNDKTIELIILDSDFLGFEGYLSIAKIKVQYPNLKMMLLTNGLTHTDISNYSKSGIFTIILKTSNKELFIRAINSALNNRIFYSDELLNIIIEHNNSRLHPILPAKVTETEISIILLIVQGLKTKEIAESKGISYHTVVSHKKNIFKKLGINSSSELIVYALSNGLIKQ